MIIIKNITIIKRIQKIIKSGKSKISKEELKEIGIEAVEEQYKLSNVLVEQAFFSGYKISVIDKIRDLDGELICENKKLLSIIKSLWEVGKITSTQLESK